MPSEAWSVPILGLRTPLVSCDGPGCLSLGLGWATSRDCCFLPSMTHQDPALEAQSQSLSPGCSWTLPPTLSLSDDRPFPDNAWTLGLDLRSATAQTTGTAHGPGLSPICPPPAAQSPQRPFLLGWDLGRENNRAAVSRPSTPPHTHSPP